jgi:chemotaxis family two-component system sensor histidine kinase/response regulator PixL
LPGFGEIAQAALQAIALHSDKSLQIAQVALADWQIGRDLVLAGDRDRGGDPSEALLALAGRTAAKTSQPENVATPSELDTQPLDAFWSEATPASLEDLFGTTVPETAVPAAEATPIDFGAPLLDDVFGSPIPDPVTPVVETTPLDEVFGSVASPEAIPEDFASPSLDEVFGSVAPSEDFAVSSFSSDEVFGSVAPSEAAPYSLDEIFGSVATPETTVTETHSVAAKPEELAEKIDAAVQSVEQIFDRLPIIEDIPPSSPLPTSLAPLGEARGANYFAPSSAVETPRPQWLPSQSPSSQEDKHPELPGTQAAKAAAAANLSVRVDFNRLERMNNLVGELSINRNSLSLQNDQIQGGVKELLSRFARFQKMTGQLRELSDRMLVTPMNAELGGLRSDRDSTAASAQSAEFKLQNLTEFDALEMDSYGALYSLLQGLVEEMIQLEESVEDIVLFARNSNQTLEQQRQMLTNLRDELMWARMLPLGEVINRFPRTLRDLSNTYHKPVKLKLSGTGVLVDKAALEKLYDPLLHLLRNAFDHGIEPPDVRKQQGKSEEGQIEIRAFHQGNQTIIEMKDDGRGLNLEKIGQKAVNIGLVTAEELAVMNQDRIAELIFEPGFSTANQISELSGRGVGLDVVRSQLKTLKGTVAVTFTPGKGTTFTLRLPLTLTISKLLVCLITQEVTGQASAVAMPSDSIAEIIIPIAEQLKKTGNQRFLHWQRQIIPIYRLSDLLTYNCALPEITSSKVLTSVPTPDDWALPLMLLRRGQQLFALEVNRLVSEQELVVKPFGGAIASPSYTYGCTILGDGTLIPVINGATLLDQFIEPETAKLTAKPALDYKQIADVKSTPAIAQTTTVLVVDDSATLRRTLALTLQKAGYRVVQARDGREALEQLQQTAGIQLVICDIEMPNMNGFEFLGQRRRDTEMSKVPVAMLTSRSSEKHRQLAMHLGASAYFTKPFIEQQFLAAIKNMLGQNFSEAIPALR